MAANTLTSKLSNLKEASESVATRSESGSDGCSDRYSSSNSLSQSHCYSQSHSDYDSESASPEACHLKRESDDDEETTQTLPISGSCGSLPPRKRAKTKDEKEQRRIERIMRNRQAAHASREKKRKHMEMLEAKCKDLTAVNEELEDQLKTVQRSQAHTLEQQSLLQVRLEQLEAAIRLARSSGDLSALDSSAQSATVAQTGSNSSFRQGSFSGPASSPVPSLVDDCASPETLLLQSENLAHSEGNSPSHLDFSDLESDALSLSFMSHIDSATGSYTSTGTVAPTAVGDTMSYDGLSKAHHPAVMVPWFG